MANEVARLNKPTASSGPENEFSDLDFALTCFVGTMDATLLQHPGTADDQKPRKMAREVPNQNVLRYGSRALTEK